MILTLGFILAVTIAESGSIQLAITLEKETYLRESIEKKTGKRTAGVLP